VTYSGTNHLIFPIDVIGMEFYLCRFPDDSVHASRILGQNTGVVYAVEYDGPR
jgi:hypothetical protein